MACYSAMVGTLLKRRVSITRQFTLLSIASPLFPSQPRNLEFVSVIHSNYLLTVDQPVSIFRAPTQYLPNSHLVEVNIP